MSSTVLMSETESRTGTLWGHPKGLYVLFFTEMWERFSYYGMRALLVLYMTKYLLFAQDKSSQIYGVYTGFVYFTPFFGGLFADRILGQRKTVILGGVLMAIGHFLMAFESLFYVALVFLVFGNGAFKPNISTQVGSLYKQGDSRRDGAFSLFYVGVNLGAFFSPFVCGTLGELYGWHYGFGAAGVGMVVGLCIYIFGQKYLAPDNIMIEKENKKQNIEQKKEALHKDDLSKIGALIVLCFFTIMFWAVYEQQGNTMALWADANTDRNLFGFLIPATWFQSLNPAFIFIFTPFVMKFWDWQAKRGTVPSSVGKMAIGCFLLGISFLIMIPAAKIVDGGSSVSMWWLVGCTFVLTIGELYLSPVGLSLVTKLAPIHMVSMLMGMWFLSSFFGNYTSGFLGTFWEKMSKESFFVMLSAIAFVAGFAMLILLRPLKKIIGHGKEIDV